MGGAFWERDAGDEKQIYYLPLLFYLGRIRDNVKFFLLFPFCSEETAFTPFGITINHIILSYILPYNFIIYFIKDNTNLDDGICGPHGIELPQGPGCRSLGDSSSEGILSLPCLLCNIIRMQTLSSIK